MTNSNLRKGWFLDETASNDTNAETFAKALTAAVSLTDQFTWPIDQLSFQSVYENVTVCYPRIFL